MTIANTRFAPPRVQEHERDLLQPWFDLTGLDESSPEWVRVWNALTMAGLAGENGLTVWPTEMEMLGVATETAGAKTVRLALQAGARCASALPGSGAQQETGVVWPTVEGLLPMTASLGVEVVLGLLHKHPQVLAAALLLPPQTAVQRILDEIKARVVGVFANAPTALAAEIELMRATLPTSDAASASSLWPPLVELILREAVNEDVFAEHVFLRVQATGVGNLDFVVLPSGGWMILRVTDRTPDSPASSGNPQSHKDGQ